MSGLNTEKELNVALNLNNSHMRSYTTHAVLRAYAKSVFFHTFLLGLCNVCVQDRGPPTALVGPSSLHDGSSQLCSRSGGLEWLP